jgi:hypothetical protein
LLRKMWSLGCLSMFSRAFCFDKVH